MTIHSPDSERFSTGSLNYIPYYEISLREDGSGQEEDDKANARYESS